MIFSNILFSQENFQVIKGTILDKESQVGIPGVIISITNTSPIKKVLSDVNGKFRLENLLPGKYDITFSYSGYKTIQMSNINLSAGKQVELDISLEELVSEIKEVQVVGTKKHETINELSSVSARSFSTEEVNRFAGGRSDPSRLAANFAGVSTPDDSRNDIVIRGNSPTGVLWRIEGLNIPNPNHFSTIGTTGGPVSGINTNILKNSDFFTSAFPSEYGNANAGVFDLGFRSGNTDKREHTIQFGMLTGIEAMTEGPIKKGNSSSYLVAYRYSFTGIAQAIGLNIGTTATPFYQDLSFKINSGNTKWGKFTLFGIGGTSKIEFKHDEVDSADLFAFPNRDSYFTSKIGLIGFSHFGRINEKSYFKTIVGATYNGSIYDEDSINKTTSEVTRIIINKTAQQRYSFNTAFHSKVNSKLFLKIGVLEELFHLTLLYKNRTYTPYWLEIWDFNDYTSLIQGFAHAKYNFTNELSMNVGFRTQFLTLNQSFALEPRWGLKWQVNTKSTLGVGYGLHSQMQPTDVYFYRNLDSSNQYVQSNKDLDFTKSHHFVLSYDWLPFKDWRIKGETYYQYLFDVPVSPYYRSYSMLNTGAGFIPNEQAYLQNVGTGENYGLELTIEKFFSKSYYLLFSGSLYESKYKGYDKVTHNTAFNGQYVYNLLFGKEFSFGKDKRQRFSFDIKFTHAGGRFFTPIDLDKSIEINKQTLKGDDFAFSEKNPDFLRLDVKFGVNLNSKKRKLSQSLFFDIQNITNNKNVFAQRYSENTKSINTAYQIGFFPNFVYKLQF
ncbi:MAG: TonB-dependent receptor [Flavobacteriia bacterium]|nr:TonB-dependent receptor [Flavobacteriia bacterium]